MEASQIIESQCCGNLLDGPKCELVKKVKLLESINFLQENQLKNALVEINKLKRLIDG